MRLREVDRAKGIGILLVMLGHSITNMDNPLNTLILSFHMPLFFFLSGIFIKPECPIKLYFSRRICVLGSSLITGFIISNITKILIDIIWLKQETFCSIDYLGALDNWFLISLFISSMIAFVLIRIGNMGCFLGGLISAILFFVLQTNNIVGIKYIEQSSLAVLFLLIGYYYGRNILQLFARNIERLSGGGYFASDIIMLFVMV